MLSLTKGGITMATVKAFTDLQQSRKLAEILPIESADMHWQDASKEYENPYGIYDGHFRLIAGNSSKIINNKRDFRKGFVLPAWSLAALLSVLPDSIYNNTNEFSQLEFSKRSVAYHDINDGIKVGSIKDNLVDACCDTILKLHKRNLL